MQLIRRFLIVISICASVFVMYFSGLFVLAYATRSYPIAAALLVPWTFGMFGIAGLTRSWTRAAAESDARLKQDTVLLSLGIIGAMVFAAVWLTVLKLAGADLTVPEFAVLLLVATPFPLIPLGLASAEIRKRFILMRGKKLSGAVSLRNLYVLLLLGCLAAGAIPILSREAIIIWYGRDLVSSAYQAADRLARGAPYCVIDFDGAGRFEEIDKRKLLLNAMERRMRRGHNYDTTYPHFGIGLKDGVYWWSFNRREFLPLYPFPGRDLPQGRWCDVLER